MKPRVANVIWQIWEGEEGKASEIEREGDRWSEEEKEMKKNEEGGGGFGLGEWKEMSEISIYIYIRENYN